MILNKAFNFLGNLSTTKEITACPYVQEQIVAPNMVAQIKLKRDTSSVQVAELFKT
jgi:hypothetical protein